MRTHRIHTHQDLQPELKISLTDGPAHYLGRVLRVVAGQTVVVFNGDGYDYVAEVLHCKKKEVDLMVMSRLPAVPESKLKITVVQALSRGERMDQTLQKCTELGVAAFQPLLSERVEVRLRAEKLNRKQAHWQNVVISACEQSGRAVVPEVLPPLTLEAWLDRDSPGRRLVLAPGVSASLARTEFSDRLELAVGPEGGYSDAEVQLMTLRGVMPVSLGARVLRTETAAPAAVAVVQALAGDLS